MKLEIKHGIFTILSLLISRKIWWTGKFLNFHTVHEYLVHPNCFKQWAHNHKTFFSILQVLFSTRQCYPARQFYPRQKQSPSKVVSKCKYIWTKPPISWKWDLLSKHASTTLVFSLEKFLTELKYQVRKKTFYFLHFRLLRNNQIFLPSTWMKCVESFREVTNVMQLFHRNTMWLPKLNDANWDPLISEVPDRVQTSTYQS